MSQLRLVLATANPHKVTEIAELLPGVELVPRPDEVREVVEDAGTLVGNARLKALAICDATGEAAVADDTGLEVDALGGLPGVESAYYAGPEHDSDKNVDKLLAEMDGVTDRSARFRTVALVRFPDGSEVVAQGVVEGHIATSRRGPHGFGYDPVFIPADGDGRSFAEMSQADKSAISHRGRAFRSLADLLA
ncbi:MAG: RdgB/HAM1 family non-canonical purine NTP pyrophosphatase [Acidimicrobiales bacterium]